MLDDDRDSVTVYFGAEVKQQEAEKLAAEIERRYPEADVAVYEGSQPHYQYILSVE